MTGRKYMRGVLWVFSGLFGVCAAFYGAGVLWGIVLMGHVPGATPEKLVELTTVGIVCTVLSIICSFIRSELKTK